MASITKHEGDKWRAHVYKNGQRRTKVFDLKKDAKAWADEQERLLKASTGYTFGAAADKYRKTQPPRSQTYIDNAVAFWGYETPIEQVTSAKVGEWRDWRLETVSGSTVNREANTLRRLFSVAVDEWLWIDRNPFKGVKLPKENNPRQAMWTWQLIKRVLRAPRTGKTAQMQRAFRVALHTGLRLQEVLLGRYDPVHAVYVLPKSKGEGEKRVEVPTIGRAQRMLTTEPFTVGPNEGSTLFSRLTGELLIEGLTFHDARGSALTWLARRVDVLTLARISRHKDMKMLLEVYYRESARDISKRLK